MLHVAAERIGNKLIFPDTFFSLLIVLKLMTWLATGFSTQQSFFTAAYLASKDHSTQCKLV